MLALKPALVACQQASRARSSRSASTFAAKATYGNTGEPSLQGSSPAVGQDWSEQQAVRLGRRLRSQGASEQHQGRNEYSEATCCHSEAVAAGDQPSLAARIAAESRFASLSRVLLVGQPGYMFRTLANRKWPSTVGPLSLLVFLFGTVMALFAAVRSALVRKVKACRCCKGFGVVRCRLCDGRGSVDWRAKFSYSEACPLCAAKRFVVCPDCGGHYHRRLFNHTRGAKGTLESFFPGTAAANGVTTRPNFMD